MRTPASSWITNGRNKFVHGNETSFGGRYTAGLCHQPPEPGWAWGMILTADAKKTAYLLHFPMPSWHVGCHFSNPWTCRPEKFSTNPLAT